MSNLSLFDDLPIPDPQTPGQALTTPGIVGSKKTLSKDQQTFNRLIQQIETKRQTLKDWEAAIDGFQQRFQNEVLVLQKKLCLTQRTILQDFDKAMKSAKGLTKAEKRKLKDLALPLARELLELLDDAETAEVKAIYNRLSGGDYDQEQASELEWQMAQVKAVAETLGIDLGDDVRTPEELFQELNRQEEAWFEEQEASQARHKKSARQIARETKAEAKAAAEAEQVSKSIKEVYRKLASALHPDREPDAAERERKTALMQRVNDAYEKKNLLDLLALQLELEHIDHSHLAQMSPEKVRRYNKTLKNQLAEIDQEIEERLESLYQCFNLPPMHTLKPATLNQLINREVKSAKEDLDQAKELAKLTKDINGLKAFLKHSPKTKKGFDPF